MNHLDLQKLPERQAKGALQKIWSDWTFSNKKNSKEAYKAISRENACHMIDTTQMLRNDRFEAFNSGRREKAGATSEGRVRRRREVPMADKTEARNLRRTVPTAPQLPEESERTL